MAQPISVSTAAFDGYDLPVAFDEIAGAGGKSVEIAYIKGYVSFDETAFTPANAAAVARALSQSGLSSMAVSAHVNASLPEAVEQLKRRMDFARRIGANIIITNAGPASLRDNLKQNLDQLIPEAVAQNVVIAFENPGHGSGDLLGTAADAADLVQSVGSPWVRINYDIGNIFTYSREKVHPEDDFEAVLPYVAHLHLKDVHSTPEGWTFTSIGDGSINYKNILRRLSQLGSAAPVGIELPLRLKRPGRQDPFRAPDPLPLSAIRTAVMRSLSFVESQLSVL